MTDRRWNYERAGQRVGPFTKEDLLDLVQTSLLRSDTDVVDQHGNRTKVSAVLHATPCVPSPAPSALGLDRQRERPAADYPPPPPLPPAYQDVRSSRRPDTNEYESTAALGHDAFRARPQNPVSACWNWLRRNQIFASKPDEDASALAGSGTVIIYGSILLAAIVCLLAAIFFSATQWLRHPGVKPAVPSSGVVAFLKLAIVSALIVVPIIARWVSRRRRS